MFQFKSFKNNVFLFLCFWFREASVSQSVPDRALGKLVEDAEDLYQRKLVIKRDLESLLEVVAKEVHDQLPQRTVQKLWMPPAR